MSDYARSQESEAAGSRCESGKDRHGQREDGSSPIQGHHVEKNHLIISYILHQGECSRRGRGTLFIG